MSESVKFEDNSMLIMEKVKEFEDVMMGLMASAIENKAKTSGEIPYLPHAKSGKNEQSGALRASVRHTKLGMGNYAITVGENSPAGAYAAAQEAGVTRGHQIKNYSTPGTGPHFMQHAVDAIEARSSTYAEQAYRTVGLH